MEYLFPRSS